MGAKAKPKGKSKADSETAMKIKVTENGPYIISGGVPMDTQIISTEGTDTPLCYRKAEDYPKQQAYALCRCGHSTGHPFCTGKHTEIGFVGTETASNKKFQEQADTIKGPQLDLKDAVVFCASGRFCDAGKGAWEYTKESDNPKSKKLATEQACNCPAGRLVIIDKKTGKAIEPDFKPSISLLEDPQANSSGPIMVKGGIPVESASGKKYETRNRVTLCRCGHSQNKPFCDGTHLQVFFNDGDKRIKRQE